MVVTTPGRGDRTTSDGVIADNGGGAPCGSSEVQRSISSRASSPIEATMVAARIELATWWM